MSETTRRLHIPLVVLVLLLATVLRIYNLGAESLWLDEGQSYTPAALPFGEMLEAVKQDTHPPLYFTILHASLRIFGETEFGMRLPSALFSTLAILLIYPVTRLLRDRETALTAMALASVALFQIVYAQEARMYSLLACLSLLSCWCFLRLYARNAGAISLAAYILATTLLLYSHVYGLFILLAQNLYVLLILLRSPERSPFGFWKWVGVQTLLALLFLPWIGVLVAQIGRVQGGFWIPEAGPLAMAKTLQSYAGTPLAFWLSIGLLGILLVTTLRPQKKPTPVAQTQSINTFSFLLLWLAVPLVIPFILSQLLQPIYVTRYTIGASFAWYILVACGITSLPRRWLQLGVLAVLLVSASLQLPRFYNIDTKTDWRTLTAYVDSNAADGDIVLFHKFNLERPFNFYTRRNDLEKRAAAPQGGHHYSGQQQDAAAVKEMVDGHERVWLVLGYTSSTAMSSKELRSILGELYTLKYEERYKSIALLLFEKET